MPRKRNEKKRTAATHRDNALLRRIRGERADVADRLGCARARRAARRAVVGKHDSRLRAARADDDVAGELQDPRRGAAVSGGSDESHLDEAKM